MTKQKRIMLILVALTLIMAIGVTAFALVWNGVILLNNPSKDDYPIRGVDVSAYQGDIDWSVLSKEGIDFAFIKATEGSTFVDRKFQQNITNALKQDIYVGAYHFFSFESGGATQAANFITTVPRDEKMLPPVIDLEFYGGNEDNPPERAKIEKELKAMLTALEQHYGKKPIIYATEESYEIYLDGDYKEYDIWIRDVIFEPKLSDGREWTFWQYTNRETLDGYSGEERFIDMNVFNSTREEFLEYVK